MQLINKLLRIPSKNYDIVFVISPCYDYQLPPLGLAYLTSYMKKCGYKIKMFDFNIEFYHTLAQNEKEIYDFILVCP